MNRLLLVIICSLLSAASALAQSSVSSKINPVGRLILQQYDLSHTIDPDLLPTDGLHLTAAGETEEPAVTIVVVMNDGADTTPLESLNVQVLSAMEGVIVATCPITECEKIAMLPQVQSLGFGDRLTPLLDFARPSTGVDDVHDGFDFDNTYYSFDGKGVVCGMVDTGFEANHINFKYTNGTSRVKRLWHLPSSDGRSTMYTDKTIGNFTTDDPDATHATHVAGILAGGYQGTGNFVKLVTPDGNTGYYANGTKLPFQGVATGADLAFGVGLLYTTNIIQGVTNIIEYAESVGKPAVINLSLGTNTGPHDGSDYFSQALSRLGQRAIICMSAGNEGDENISINKTFTLVTKKLYTVPVSLDSGDIIDGAVDLWTNGSDPVIVTVKACDGDLTSAVELMSISQAGQSVVSTSSQNFDRYFTGQLSMTSNVSSYNKRYNVYMNFDKVEPKNSNADHRLLIEVSGQAGTKLYLYGSKVQFSDKLTTSGSQLSGATKGTPDQSISSICCGDNLISVGAYVSRTSWCTINGYVHYYFDDYSVGQIAPFSSYGSTYQGKRLPHVCAPGANIISSYSGYYLADVTTDEQMCAVATSAGNKYYWGPMQGTSMSCPYVAGTVALWLEADPSLSVDDIVNIINTTSTFDSTMDAARWGAGCIDALAGVKEVLRRKAEAGIDGIIADSNSHFVISPLGRRAYSIMVDTASELAVRLYDTRGIMVASASAQSNETVIDTSNVSPGIYILHISTPNGFNHSRRLVIN